MPLFKRKKEDQEVKKKAKKVKGDPKRKPPKKKKAVAIHSQAFRILKTPLVTEKGTSLGALNKYLFEVDVRVNKSEIKKAIEELYGVKVVKVNIVNLQGKQRRYGRSVGRTRARKKAIVTLRAGDTITLFEGV